MADIEAIREALIALQRRHDAAQKQLNEFSAIFASTRDILAASTDSDIEAAMFRGISEASGAEVVALLQTADDQLVCTHASKADFVGAKFPNATLMKTIMGGRALALPDIRRPPELAAATQSASWLDYAGAALFPFQGPVQTGIVVLLGREIGAFQAKDAERLRVFGMIAAQGMAALHRMQLAVERAAAEAGHKAALAADSAKSLFLANMSHEIRTPLNGVLGMAQSLQAEQLSLAQREKIDVILDSGTSLLTLLNDVLDISKIEAGKLEISVIPGDFEHDLRRIRQLFEPQIAEKGLKLEVGFAQGFPQRLVYDPVRVRQCLSNLLSNAIKFTERGCVEVIVSAEPQADRVHLVAIEVRDSGIGIRPEIQEKLFSVFTQADSSVSRRFGGTGLGLAISRRLANLMGGDITVSSQEGKGSTFRFTFEASEPAEGDRRAAPAIASLAPLKSNEAMPGIRILLTDDNPVNRRVVKLFLAFQQCEIIEASDGQEALDKLASEPFDIVLLDVHMPVMDGKEAIRRIRASDQPWRDLPVIALTADAMIGDRERYLAMGMSDYLSKPVDQRELISKMHYLLDGIRVSEPKAFTGY